MRHNLVRIAKAAPGILPFEKATFYKWHHLGLYPGIFIKLGGGLFVDLAALAEVMEAGRGKAPRRARG